MGDIARPSAATSSDAEIVARIREGDHALFEILMRRHNQRVYRVVRAVLKDENDVEDVMQQAYINAFTHLGQFAERSMFSTWLTRIALNEAFSRRKKTIQRDLIDDREESMERFTSPQADPEHLAYAHELRYLLQVAVDQLPETYRTVFMLRDVEGLSTDETAESLGLGEEAVKTRLHRARGMIRRAITERIGSSAGEAFQFHAPRCDRVVAAVLARLASQPGTSGPDTSDKRRLEGA